MSQPIVSAGGAPLAVVLTSRGGGGRLFKGSTMSDSQHYDEWTQAAASGTYTPLQSGRLLEMFAWTTRYGGPNCWTGCSGTAAAMIRELLRERIGLKDQIERLSDELRRLPAGKTRSP